MLVPWEDLKNLHPKTAHRIKGSERKRRRLEKEETRASMERSFREYDHLLTNITVFK